MRRTEHETDIASVHRVWPLFEWIRCLKCRGYNEAGMALAERDWT